MSLKALPLSRGKTGEQAAQMSRDDYCEVVFSFVRRGGATIEVKNVSFQCRRLGGKEVQVPRRFAVRL